VKNYILYIFHLCCTASTFYLERLWHPEDGCGVQPKYVRAIKPIVQLAGERCV